MNNFEKIKSCKSIDEMHKILNILCFETMKQTIDAINKRLGDKSPDMSIILKSWLQAESDEITEKTMQKCESGVEFNDNTHKSTMLNIITDDEY